MKLCRWTLLTQTRANRDSAYLAEALLSAQKLVWHGLGVLFQTNNTELGTGSLWERIWRTTGKIVYRDFSLVSEASILSHLCFWDLGPETRTHMALPRLHDARYVALQEEGKILATPPAWQKIMGEAASKEAHRPVPRLLGHSCDKWANREK